MKRRTFCVSDKVVCIRDRGLLSFTPIPRKGEVYVVKEVVYEVRPSDGIPGLKLVGIRGDRVDGLERVLCASRFRHLEDVRAANARKRTRRKATVEIPVMAVTWLTAKEEKDLYDSSEEAARFLAQGRVEEARRVLAAGGWRGIEAQLRILVRREGCGGDLPAMTRNPPPLAQGREVD